MRKSYCYYEHVAERVESCPQGGRLQCAICAFHEKEIAIKNASIKQLQQMIVDERAIKENG